MKKSLVITSICIFVSFGCAMADKAQVNNAHQFSFTSIDGKVMSLSQFAGKSVLIVNTASKCGFTRQYSELQSLWDKMKGEGLVVLGVPSNDFGGQEPGSAKEIQSFCQLNYGVSFPMSEKVKINGDQQHELYDFLTKSNTKHKGKVRWNFTKFLVDKNGDVIDRFSPLTKPLSKKIVTRITQVIK